MSPFAVASHSGRSRVSYIDCTRTAGQFHALTQEPSCAARSRRAAISIRHISYRTYGAAKVPTLPPDLRIAQAMTRPRGDEGRVPFFPFSLPNLGNTQPLFSHLAQPRSRKKQSKYYRSTCQEVLPSCSRTDFSTTQPSCEVGARRYIGNSVCWPGPGFFCSLPAATRLHEWGLICAQKRMMI